MFMGPGGEWAPHDRLRSSFVDPLSLTMSIVGLVISLTRPLDSSCLILVVWASATFLFGQVLTSVPHAAYRASPMLPALAISAAFGATQSFGLLARWRPGRPIGMVLGAMGLSWILAWNMQAVKKFRKARQYDALTGIGRTVAAGPQNARYYVATFNESPTWPEMEMMTHGRVVTRLTNLSEAILNGIPSDRDAVFVLSPEFKSLESLIRECFEVSRRLEQRGASASAPIVGLSVGSEALRSPTCELQSTQSGLDVTFQRPDGTMWTRRALSPIFRNNESDPFTEARATARLRIDTAGTHRFAWYLAGADAWIRVNGTHLPEGQADVRLDASEVLLQLGCAPTSQRGVCVLMWNPPGQSGFTIVPHQALTHTLTLEP